MVIGELLLFTGYDSEDYEPQQAITGTYKIVNTRINAAKATRVMLLHVRVPMRDKSGD